MRAEGRNGAVDLIGEAAAVRAVLPSVAYRVGGTAQVLAPSRLDGPSEGPWSGHDDHLRLTVSTRPTAAGGPGLVIRAAVTVVGDRPVRLDEVTVLATGGPAGLELGRGPARWSLLRNGWTSWSTTRAHRMDDRDGEPRLDAIRSTTRDPSAPRTDGPGRFRSELVAGLADLDSGAGVVLGFLGATRALSSVDLAVTPPSRTSDDLVGGRLLALEATSHLDGIALAPGATTTSEDLLVADGPDAIDLLERWAEAFGLAQAARVPARPPHGWCSWYYHRTRVTEADARRALAAAEDVAADVPIGYVMVDDGHQATIGDWLTTKATFPSGMAALAGAIAATGRDAGIWLAPFLVDPRSDVARAHPDWVLVDDTGAPVRALWHPKWNARQALLALDCTRPEVVEHLAEVARTLRHDWGFRVLKLDYCFVAALPARRHDDARTRAEALRAGLDAIRRGAGDDAVLIGSGAPLGPAVGVVDAMRIGCDVAPIWGGGRVSRWATADQGGHSTRLAARNALTRAFLHGHLWANDPDCVLVRTDRTRLTTAEVRLLVAAVALTDGMIVSSDRLDLVPPERLDLLRLAHELAGGHARVVDLFAAPEPSTVVSTKADEILWGHLHWDDAPRRVHVELAGPEWERLGVARPASVTEAFTGEVLDVDADGRVELGLLGPHDARVLRIPRRR